MGNANVHADGLGSNVGALRDIDKSKRSKRSKRSKAMYRRSPEGPVCKDADLWTIRPAIVQAEKQWKEGCGSGTR